MNTINIMNPKKTKRLEIKCGHCYGTGIYQIPNGPDDFDWEMCHNCEAGNDFAREIINRGDVINIVEKMKQEYLTKVQEPAIKTEKI